MRDVVFIHIPKTAGTSFRHALARARQDTLFLLDYGAGKVETSPLLVERIYEARNRGPQDLRAVLPPGEPVTLVGHFAASRYAGAFSPQSMVTFLRPPLERLVSHYNHVVNLNGYDKSFASFIRRPRMQNLQSRFLEGVPLEDIGFIGLTDAYEEHMARLSAFIGARVQPLAINAGNYRVAKKSVINDPDIRAEAEALNAEDLALYERVASEIDYFTRRRPRPAPDAALVTSRVWLNAQGLIDGWAVDRESRGILDIVVRANGRIVAELTADQFRPELVETGIASWGIGGFQLDPRPLGLAGTALDFEIRGVAAPVEGSPIRLG